MNDIPYDAVRKQLDFFGTKLSMIMMSRNIPHHKLCDIMTWSSGKLTRMLCGRELPLYADFCRLVMTLEIDPNEFFFKSPSTKGLTDDDVCN